MTIRRASPRALAQRFLVACTGLFIASAPAWAGIRADTSAAPYVSPATVKIWMEEGKRLVFLDVREADEFAAGHLPGAINIVYDQVDGLAKQLPHDRPIVAYCIHSAHRAPEAAKTLRRLGFENVVVLEGGIVAWQTEGLTIRANNVARTPKILPLTKRCAELGATTTTEIR